MVNNWLEKWNKNYKQKEYIYGKNPNLFFKQEIDKLPPSNILLPAEGEGRNAIYTAKKGWNVTAFDISIEGKNKAMNLAKENNVSIDYLVGDLLSLDLPNAHFDVISLIYAHFPPNIRANYHQILIDKLKDGGTIILEGFSKNHLKYKKNNPNIGGPGHLDFLFSIEEIKKDFKGFVFSKLQEVEIELHEGLFHNGKTSVIRFIGKKTSNSL